MNKLEQLLYLNDFLLKEMPEYQKQGDSFPKTEKEQRVLLRSLMNLRPPMKLDADFLEVQDKFLCQEVEAKGVVNLSDLKPSKKHENIYLWQGDITTLAVDSIVNAANSALLGCFHPCHACIDNAIHSLSGLQLRQDCHHLMEAQGHPEETGKAKVTSGYNLPSKHVIHTVGPIISGALTENDCTMLKNCYNSCLNLALEHNFHSIAFCCISTGEFHFPQEEAAQIAVETICTLLQSTNQKIEVIFNVFQEKDREIYRRLLG